MNNARLWTIVNPTVGVPLFFIGVAVASLFVHVMVINATPYFENYVTGASAQAAAEVESE